LNWKKDFHIQEKTDDISRLLTNVDKIREAHSKLVPVAVSYTDFWERYYYKLHKLNIEEERRAALVKRATNQNVDEEELGWDVEEEGELKAEKSGKDIPKKEVEEYFDKLEIEPMKTKEIVEQEKPSVESVKSETIPISESKSIVETPEIPKVQEVEKTEKARETLKQTPPVAPKTTKNEPKTKEEWDNWE